MKKYHYEVSRRVNDPADLGEAKDPRHLMFFAVYYSLYESTISRRRHWAIYSSVHLVLVQRSGICPPADTRSVESDRRSTQTPR